MRLFHTELEAVYEEKNRGLDSDSDLCFESLLASLYQKHGYGTKTTIGTIEHLKNPSIKEIRRYFEKYYVANNMAICISGDFEPDQVIPLIDKYFGTWKSGNDNAQMTFPSEEMMSIPIEKTITGPEEASVYIAYRTPPVSLKKHNLALEMINKMLYNGQAGLIDLDLVEKQKVIYAYAGIEQWTDGGFMLLNAKPMPGNTLEQTKEMLLAEIEKIKKGEFSDELMNAISANLAKEDYLKFESYKSRAFLMVNAFIGNEPWIDIVSKSEELARINKEFIVQMANLYFQNNYVVIYKRTGERENQVKVEKPQITPVMVNREDRSPFYQQILAQKVSSVSPKFVDLDKDLQKSEIKPGMTLKSVKNTVNPLFSLEYVWKIGKLNDPVMAFAADYLQYLGTKALTSSELKMKMYALACEYSISVMDNELRISISGIDGNLEKAAQLIDGLLKKAVADKPVLDNMIAAILQERADERKNRDVIRDAVNQYGLYGPENKYTVRLKENEMKALKPADLIKKIKSLSGIRHDIYYYGPRDGAQLALLLPDIHKTGKTLAAPPPVKRFVARNIDSPVVFFANYPDMAQAEMTWSMKSGSFDKDMMPQIRLYNEYFGGGMAGIVFQTIRESKALAYSTYSNFRVPYTKEEPFTMLSYVGTQADKISEAAPAMTELIDNLPESENLLEMSKKSIRNVIETERIIKQNIIYYSDNMDRLGLHEDIRKAYYEKIPSMNFSELKRFAESNIKGQKRNMMVLGDEKKVNFGVLSAYGKVEKVSLDQIFGEAGTTP